MGLIFILLSATCSVLIAHFLKMSEQRKRSTLNVLTVNYLVAVIAAVYLNYSNGLAIIPEFPLWFWFYTAFIGVLFVVNLFILSKSVDFNGMGSSIVAMRLSLMVPVIVAFTVYSEPVTITKIMGILLVFGSLYLLVQSRRKLEKQKIGKYTLLLALFFFSGIIDTSFKVFEMEMGDVAVGAHFMSVIFFSAFIVALSSSIYKGEVKKIGKQDLIFGLLVGIPNLFASIFLINAFATIDASIVYPVVNILIIIAGTIVGLFVWKDRLEKAELIGIVLGVFAILVLLST